MKQLSDKFDERLEFVGFPVFTEYKDALSDHAKKYAVRELELYQERLQLEKQAQRRHYQPNNNLKARQH